MIGSSVRAACVRLAVFLFCTGMLAPIAVVIVASFSGDSYLQFPPTSFSLQWYGRFLGDPRWLNALWNSVAIAALTCVIATTLGFLAAYAMTRGMFSFRRIIVALLLMPLIVPHVITAIALYFLSAKLGVIGFRPWIAVAHSVIALPVVLVILQSALKTLDPNLERAAMIFGCDRLGVFRRIVLPSVSPGIISALLFSFLTSFDELVISLFLAGIKAQTLPLRIWNSLQLEVEPTIAAVSSVLIGVTVVTMGLEWAVRNLRTRQRIP